MRSRGIADQQALLALRSGELSFDDFASEPAVRESAFSRAKYFLRRWPYQDLHDEDDLMQDALLATWRAVDTWDPERKSHKGELVTIKRYVEYQVGNALERKMRKASGDPRKGRSQPARKVHFADLVGRHVCSDGALSIERLIGAYPAGQSHRLEALEAAMALVDPLERKVVLSVVRGHGLDVAADEIYNDVSARMRLRLDSRVHAGRFVLRVANKAAARFSAAG